MAHAQKPDLRLSAKRTSPFKSAGPSVQSTAGSRGVRISCSNAGYTMFRGSVKGSGYPPNSPFSPLLPLPCVTACHYTSTGVYLAVCFCERERDRESTMTAVMGRLYRRNLRDAEGIHEMILSDHVSHSIDGGTEFDENYAETGGDSACAEDATSDG